MYACVFVCARALIALIEICGRQLRNGIDYGADKIINDVIQCFVYFLYLIFSVFFSPGQNFLVRFRLE